MLVSLLHRHCLDPGELVLADPDPPLSARQLNSSPFSRDHADPGMHRTRAVGANLSSLSSGLAPWDSLIHCQRVTVADPLVSGISDILHDPVMHQALERGVTSRAGLPCRPQVTYGERVARWYLADHRSNFPDGVAHRGAAAHRNGWQFGRV